MSPCVVFPPGLAFKCPWTYKKIGQANCAVFCVSFLHMGGGSICKNWLSFCKTSIKDAQLRLCQLEYYLSPQIIYGSRKALMMSISSDLYK